MKREGAMGPGYLPKLPWHATAWLALQPLRARGVHAVLLHGAAGIGKKSLAIDLARAALCEAPRPDGHACGACAGCLLAEAGSHPDLRIVVPDTLADWRSAAVDEGEETDGAGAGESADFAPPEERQSEGEAAVGGKAGRRSAQILLDQVRALAPFLATSTHRGGSRVVVLAPAEALRTEAANALLKMLEEPPPCSLFVMATDAPDEVLPTIRSRCVLVGVATPAHSEALAWLRTQPLEDPESALAEAGGAPLVALAGGRLDGDTSKALWELLARGPLLTPAQVVAQVPKGVPVGPALALLQRWGWDLLAFSMVRSPSVVRYHPRQSALLGRLSDQCETDALLTWLAQLSGDRRAQDHPLNARLVIEAALLDYIACFRRTGTPAAPAAAHADRRHAR